MDQHGVERGLGEPRIEEKMALRAPKGAPGDSTGGQREPQRVTIVIDPEVNVVILEALGCPKYLRY